MTEDDIKAIEARRGRAAELHDVWVRTKRGEKASDLALFLSWQDVKPMAAEIGRLRAVLERIGKSNRGNMNTLHPDGCALEALDALAGKP